MKEHCIKCLLEELDPARYEREIGRLLALMDREMKTSPEEYDRRRKICKACDYLSKGTCNACGCFVELRAATNRSHCPYKKWSMTENSIPENRTLVFTDMVLKV